MHPECVHGGLLLRQTAAKACVSVALGGLSDHDDWEMLMQRKSALRAEGGVEVRRDEPGIRWWLPENCKSHLAISSAREAPCF